MTYISTLLLPANTFYKLTSPCPFCKEGLESALLSKQGDGICGFRIWTSYIICLFVYSSRGVWIMKMDVAGVGFLGIKKAVDPDIAAEPTALKNSMV